MNVVHVVGQQLCKAWGLDPNVVEAIEVHFDAKEALPYAIVRLLCNEQTMQVLLDLAPVAP